MVSPGSDSGEVIVEVAYATRETQALITLRLPAGATVSDAIRESGLLHHFPEIDLSANPVGIFGKVCSIDRILQPQDRVEIYRPLLNDPKEARRQRAVKK